MASTPETLKVNDIHDVLIRVHFEDPQKVSQKETGRLISKQIYSKQWGQEANTNFFRGRVAHQRMLELWSLGKQDVTEFLPLMGVSDAQKAEVQIDTTPSMTASFFADTLVELLSKNEETPQVKAVDDGSQEEKINRFWEAMFRMQEVGTIDDLQQQIGIQLEPTNAYVPDTKLSAQVYYTQKDQLPKEIRFNKILQKTLIENDYERVLKPFLIRSNVVFNVEAAKVTRGEGKNEYCIRPAVYSNLFYNFFKTDTGKKELYYIGETYNITASELRKKYGKSDRNKEGASEKEIYDIIKQSSVNGGIPNGFNYNWDDRYGMYSGGTPWDDCTGFLMDFEIKISEAEYYVSSLDNYGNENVVQKKGIPNVSSPNSKVIKKIKDCVYNCIYSPYTDKVLLWKKQGEEFSWKINIPHNNGEYIPSLFERGMPDFRELQLVKLKKRHFIGQLSPAIYDVDVDRIKNVTIGGKRYGWDDIVRIRTLTGANLYSSRGLDPTDVNNAPAIRTALQDPTLQRIIELDAVEKGLIASLRELLGLPVYMDGSNVGQRTAGKLAEGQRQAAGNVTGFISNSHNQLMEDILNHICTLAWEDVVTDERETDDDLINTKFKAFVKMKMTAVEKERLEIDIDRWSKTPDENGKPLLSPADAFAIRQIDDMQLAEMYLADKVAENERKAQRDKAEREQAIIDSQSQSNQDAAEKAIQLQKDKIKFDKQMAELNGRNKKEQILLEKGLDIWKAVLTPKTGMDGVVAQQPQLPTQLQELLNLTFQSVAQSLTVEMNKTEEELQQEAQEQEMQMQAAAEQAAIEEQQMMPQ